MKKDTLTPPFLAKALVACALLLSATAVHAGEVTVAVASNVTKPMQSIAALFEAESGHTVKLAFGSSGRFFAQIHHGAPFDVFLSADADKPKRLIEQGLAVTDSQFTYAQGRLVLWSPQMDYVDKKGDVLKMGDFNHLALADAKLAPYGLAAQQVLDNLNLMATLKPRFVTGENISQTFQFVQSGNAELGFVALSQVMQDGEISTGSSWLIPVELHEPIKQDVVLLKRGEDNAAAKALMDFLKSDAAITVLESYGYQVPVPEAAADAE